MAALENPRSDERLKYLGECTRELSVADLIQRLEAGTPFASFHRDGDDESKTTAFQ
jgi:hypothetical protein